MKSITSIIGICARNANCSSIMSIDGECLRKKSKSRAHHPSILSKRCCCKHPPNGREQQQSRASPGYVLYSEANLPNITSITGACFCRTGGNHVMRHQEGFVLQAPPQARIVSVAWWCKKEQKTANVKCISGVVSGASLAPPKSSSRLSKRHHYEHHWGAACPQKPIMHTRHLGSEVCCFAASKSQNRQHLMHGFARTTKRQHHVRQKGVSWQETPKAK